MAGRTEEELEQEQIEQENEKARERGDFVDDDDPPADDDKGEDADEADPPAGEKEDEPRAPVPYARFKEVNTKAEAERDARIRAEAERDLLLQRGKEGVPAPAAPTPPVDVRALRRKAREALLEGDIDKASELDDKADEEISRLAEERAVQRSEQSNAARDLAAAASRVTAKYPFLDSNGDDADQDAIEMVIAMRNANIQRGMSPGEALEKAGEKVGKLYAKEAPEPAEDDRNKARTQEALRRSARAGLTQPPPTAGGRGERGRGSTTDVDDVATLSDEEFRKLPEKEKARRRGDIV